MVFYHFLCNMYRIGGSSKMTLVEPSIKTVETFFEYFQDYWHHDWIIRHPTLYWKEKQTKNNANAFWCRNLCQICCPIAEICWWILLFRSAGPWDCAASAIARSSKAAYVQWTSHLYRFIIHITTLMWVLDFTGVNPIPTTQHIPFLHIMMNNTHVTKTTQSIPLGPIGK